jgi:hypothetical protein
MDFFVEIIIRNEKAPANKAENGRRTTQDALLKDLHPYLVFESDDKSVFNVPVGWVGFKDGTIISMLREFSENMYAALAYFSMYENESITDFDGNPVDAYDTIFNGQRMKKFVKKKIQIVKIIDTAKDVFTLRRYILDLKFTDPVLKVMDLYSDASNGGIGSKEFAK